MAIQYPIRLAKFSLATIILLSAWLLVFPSGQSCLAQQESVKQQKSFQRIVDDFNATVEAGVNADGGGCAMVAVFKGNEILWSKGFGLADVDNKIAANAKTIGRTGSITKSFTAVLICQLAEQGLLKLDDPVHKHFPEIKQLADAPDDSKSITYRMLASHTAGLVREPKFAFVTARGPIDLWEQKVLQSI